jgi:hypothetical protein
MAYRVGGPSAREDPPQAAEMQSMIDAPRSDPEVQKLGPGDDAMLGGRERRNRLIVPPRLTKVG